MCQKCNDAALSNAKVNILSNPMLAGAIIGLGQISQTTPNEAAAHKQNEQTLMYLGNDKVKVKPFTKLEDVIVTGEKLKKLVYPEQLGQERIIEKYEADLIRAASAIPALPQDGKFEGLVELLGLALIGFDVDDIEDVKASLASLMEKKATTEVRNNTVQFLKERGFAEI